MPSDTAEIDTPRSDHIETARDPEAFADWPREVYADMLAWLSDRDAHLPSGQEVDLQAPRLLAFCGD